MNNYKYFTTGSKQLCLSNDKIETVPYLIKLSLNFCGGTEKDPLFLDIDDDCLTYLFDYTRNDIMFLVPTKYHNTINDFYDKSSSIYDIDDIITVNISGTHFKTLKQTLLQSCYFKTLFKYNDNSNDKNKEIYIDFNPDIFQHVLSYLRHNIEIPEEYEQEAQFFNLTNKIECNRTNADMLYEPINHNQNLDQFNSVPSDIYLTGNPQVTFMKNVYRRYNDFNEQIIKLSSVDSIKIGECTEIVVSSDTKYDLLGASYLFINVSKNINTTIERKLFPYYLIEYIELHYYDNNKEVYIDRLTGEFIYLHSKLNGVEVIDEMLLPLPFFFRLISRTLPCANIKGKYIFTIKLRDNDKYLEIDTNTMFDIGIIANVYKEYQYDINYNDPTPIICHQQEQYTFNDNMLNVNLKLNGLITDVIIVVKPKNNQPLNYCYNNENGIKSPIIRGTLNINNNALVREINPLYNKLYHYQNKLKYSEEIYMISFHVNAFKTIYQQPSGFINITDSILSLKLRCKEGTVHVYGMYYNFFNIKNNNFIIDKYVI